MIKLCGDFEKFMNLDSTPHKSARASCKIRINDLLPYSELVMGVII